MVMKNLYNLIDSNKISLLSLLELKKVKTEQDFEQFLTFVRDYLNLDTSKFEQEVEYCFYKIKYEFPKEKLLSDLTNGIIRQSSDYMSVILKESFEIINNLTEKIVNFSEGLVDYENRIFTDEQEKDIVKNYIKDSIRTKVISFVKHLIYKVFSNYYSDPVDESRYPSYLDYYKTFDINTYIYLIVKKAVVYELLESIISSVEMNYRESF